MRAPMSWLAEHADLPADINARRLADALIRVGLEVEGIESAGDALSGPIVVGRVLSAEPEPQKNGKTINWCQVDVGETDPRGIVCGAHNFGPGDLVVVSLPGAVLPGGFAIAARTTYGHVSDGMICSAQELGAGTDHDGIIVLPAGSAAPGEDPLATLGLRETVLDVAVTTDRGYCLSIRGLARRGRRRAGRRLPRGDRRRAGSGRPRLPRPHRRPVRLRPLLGACRHRPGPVRAHPGLAGEAVAAVRHALDLTRRGRHQLRHARDRSAAARFRRRPASPGRWSRAGRRRGRS